MLLSYGIRIGLQAVAFIALARLLGPAQFGAFSALLAVASLIGPFVDLGAYALIVRDIAAGVPPSRAAGNSLLLGVVALPPAMALLAVAKIALVPTVGWLSVVGVGLAVFCGVRANLVYRAVAIGIKDVRRNAVLEAMAGVAQLCGVMVLAQSRGGIDAWAVIYAVQSCLVGGAAIVILGRRWGALSASWPEARARVKEGAYFAVGFAAQTAYVDCDKALLGATATLQAAGLYSAAQRVVGVLFLPLMALEAAVYPNFFEAGRAGGLAAARRVAWKFVPVVLGYGGVACVLLIACRRVIANVFGAEFGETGDALAVLAPLLVIQGLNYPFADALTATGRQGLRTAAQIGTLIVNAGLNITLDPTYGWRGAVAATIASQSILLVFLVLAAPAIAARIDARRARGDARSASVA